MVLREPGMLYPPYPSADIVVVAGIEHLAAAWAHRPDGLPVSIQENLGGWLRHRFPRRLGLDQEPADQQAEEHAEEHSDGHAGEDRSRRMPREQPDRNDAPEETPGEKSGGKSPGESPGESPRNARENQRARTAKPDHRL